MGGIRTTSRPADSGGDPRRSLPSVDEVLELPDLAPLLAGDGRARIADRVRAVVAELRDGLAPGAEEPGLVRAVDGTRAGLLVETVQRVLRTSGDGGRPRRVLNATGVLVHTNLGRAPLGSRAVAALVDAAGTTPVELDLATGRRGPRGAATTQLLAEIVGAEDALVVNNGAAALVLAVAATADGGPVVVSRGELVEIGGSFRLPEVIAAAGVELAEVGTTNRTHLDDYERALERTGAQAVLRVHPSNFAVTGFTARPDAAALAEVVHDAGAVLVHDVGSGLLDDDPVLPAEPSLAGALRDGADLALASGDKLLGGPQAGLFVGRADLVEQARRHPLARAMRVDKLRFAALAATLRDHAVDPTDVPAVAMRRTDLEALQVRATGVVERVRRDLPDADIDVRASEALLGAGSAPDRTLPSVAVVATVVDVDVLAARLRGGDPPVVARITDGRLWCDLRSLAPDDDTHLATALVASLA